MSSNISEAKIKRMADKYRKYKAKDADKVEERKFWQHLTRIVVKLQIFWIKVVPFSIRGHRGQFQLFNYYWKEQVRNDCNNQLICKTQIEQVLQAYKQGDPIVLGLAYEPQSINNVISFISTINESQYKGNITLCPLNLEATKYKQQIQKKIELYSEQIIILWRGLFNEIIILTRFNLSEMSSLSSIRQQVQKRREYEGRIKECAERSRDDSKSQLFI